MVFMDSPYRMLGVWISGLDLFGRLVVNSIYALTYFQVSLSLTYLETSRRLSLLLPLTMLAHASSSLHTQATFLTLPFCMLWLSIAWLSLWTFRGVAYVFLSCVLMTSTSAIALLGSSYLVVCSNSLEGSCSSPRTSWHDFCHRVFWKLSLLFLLDVRL